MVFDDHDVSDGEVRVESAGGVGQDDRLHSHQLKHTDRHGGLPNQISTTSSSSDHTESRLISKPAETRHAQTNITLRAAELETV